jgi:2-oxoglutarate ferredoxin oxidoreductase subunit delta
MAIITIKEDSCKGCGLCVRACPKDLLKLSDSKINVKGYHPAEMTDMEACVACASCARTCPDCCIEVEK